MTTIPPFKGIENEEKGIKRMLRSVDGKKAIAHVDAPPFALPNTVSGPTTLRTHLLSFIDPQFKCQVPNQVYMTTNYPGEAERRGEGAREIESH